MGVTTKDIAQICGVSRTTVNRAFTNTGRINKETKEKILRIAEELNYRPDLLATGLKNGKTQCLGVVVFDVRNRYFAQMLNAIEIEAKSREYFINITLHEKDRKQEQEMVQRLVDYRVEGLLLSPVSKGNVFADFLKKMEKPIVIIGNRVDEQIPFVGIDEKKAAKDAVRTILGKGYQNIVFVCPPLADVAEENVYSHEQREMGFLEEVSKHKEVSYEVLKSWNYLEEVEKILSLTNEKTAFFCSGDIFALDIMKYLKQKNKKAGQDYGIMGFDNIDTLDYVIPRLTTIDNMVEKVATKAADILFDLIQGKEVPTKTLVDYKEIEGETL
ncbi:MAG: LacI family DNA-binding transcriptional regulator [Lachnospiraceae bacterium]|nr:LacI family DNA-binding transcriptional regulator [Lachnospiraceae bacterium]